MARDSHKDAVSEAVQKVLEVDIQKCLQEKLFSEGLRPDVEVEVQKVTDLQTVLRVTWPGTHRRYFLVKVSEQL